MMFQRNGSLQRPWHSCPVLLISAVVLGCSPNVGSEHPVISYENALWWNGSGFEAGNRLVAGGMFVDAPQSVSDSTVDLRGRWVVPPFGDAHTHNLDGDTAMAAQYVREGVFYVQVLTNTISGASKVRKDFESPETIDVVYANAGVSSEFGHPLLAYEPRAMGLPWTAYDEHRSEICESRIMEGEAYWFIENEEELDDVWPRVLASSPQVIKIYLLHSEDPEPLGCDRMGLTGMTPELARLVVERANQADLRVWAHVETARDAAIAVDMGVAGLAHLPGYGSDEPGNADLFQLDRATMSEAGFRGVYVTPTLQLLDVYNIEDSTSVARARALQRRNLEAWTDAGGRVAIGSDYYARTARAEVDAFAALGLWDNTEILKLWSEDTPRAIYPDRQIGRLAPDYEASWLVLACDPTRRLECVDEIEGRMKQGIPIQPWMASVGDEDETAADGPGGDG